MPNFRTQRIMGRLIRLLAVLFIIAINAILIWRIFFSVKIPEQIDALAINDDVRLAYEEQGDSLQLLYQDQASVTRAEHNYGYFSVPKCTFLPQANQVQVVFRYNNSTLKNLAKDYELEQIPTRDADLFDVTLVLTTDLTPDNRDDNTDPATLSKERILPTEIRRERTSLYTYYLLVFENVRVEEITAGVFVDIYYREDIDYDREAYGTLCLYSPDDEWLTRSLTRTDKKALKDKQ